MLLLLRWAASYDALVADELSHAGISANRPCANGNPNVNGIAATLSPTSFEHSQATVSSAAKSCGFAGCEM